VCQRPKVVDLVASAALLLLIAATCVASMVLPHRLARDSTQRDAGVLFPARVQTPLYWVARLLVTRLALLRVSPNTVTLCSLAWCVVGSVMFALGHFGLGAAMVSVGFAGDAIDGLLARATNQVSAAGAVLDSVVDRVGEGCVFAGLAIFFRWSPWALALVLVAGFVSQVISYVSAKVDASGATNIPRGWMRRAERAAHVVIGAVVTSFLALRVTAPLCYTPMLVEVGLIATIGGVSAAHRLAVLLRVLEATDP
jgi:CDP-diacylglycerol---glycerol-3-phosphate 3-phosphatidyltransferase